MKITKTLVTTLAFYLCFGGVAQARSITSISPPTGPGQGDIFCIQVQTPVATPFPNNDNSTTASQNQILNFPGLSCSPKTFQAIAPIDTQLFVEPSGGTTEYFFTETAVNNTNSTWDGFSFQIGFGVNDNFAPPELILVPTGTVIPDFDFNGSSSDPEPTSSKFTQLIQDSSFGFQWSGGSVAPGESVDFTFSVDVPDDLAGNDFYNSFTIRQLPNAESIPEPASTSGFLALLGVLGSIALKHKNKMNEG
ncbi:PEP-CTERM sorting domain-containing protein [Nostoc sp. UHCC 0252]|uniref:PEP-CTERM sorting domain-containing protein n=1 Tax=Nostoc sp. UHCC 0252 TaxID=3110241 RepID=UPI002B21CF8C|nr:PEP-CTERM sorting domain-containing protein [Nostoc sp. UHCC 0252]MEA5603562.1 PEP-CTERM sorting domain-containing protein [Nostoc sp. UHCC 0252]